MRSTLYLPFFLLLLGGCASIPTLQERQKRVDALASHAHLHSFVITTPRFSLYSLSDVRECENKAMRVYIEGDGFAWATHSRLSEDPTPINPFTAGVMASDPSRCKVYIARPCQYVGTDGCDSTYWSDKRFAGEVIESYNDALDQIKNRYRNDSFFLIGYSGGGAVAALSAAYRDDVRRLVTIAGNLDTEAWVKHHAISPLIGSLNPADFASKLESIPQLHLIGSDDTIMPKEIFLSYQRRFKNPETIRYKIIPQASHSGGWEHVLDEMKNNSYLPPKK